MAIWFTCLRYQNSWFFLLSQKLCLLLLFHLSTKTRFALVCLFFLFLFVLHSLLKAFQKSMHEVSLVVILSQQKEKSFFHFPTTYIYVFFETKTIGCRNSNRKKRRNCWCIAGRKNKNSIQEKKLLLFESLFYGFSKWEKTWKKSCFPFGQKKHFVSFF